MPRTAVARSGVARSGVARSPTSALRVPYWLIDLGLVWMIDWRTGKTGANSRVVQDLMNKGRSVTFRGTTALSTVYSNGNYYADLEETAVDYFRSQVTQLSSSPMTALSIVSALKRENINISGDVLGMWKAVGTQRSFRFRIFNSANNNKFGMFFSNNGGAINEWDSDTSTDAGKINDSNFHVIGVSWGASVDPILYKDGVAVGGSYASGSAQAQIFNSSVEMSVGELQDAAGLPTSLVDGKLGVQMIFLATLSAAEQLAVKNYIQSAYSF